MGEWEPDRGKIGGASDKDVADAIKAARAAAEDPDDEGTQPAVDVVKKRFGK